MTAVVPLRRMILGVTDHRYDKAAAQTAMTFAGQIGLEMLGLFIDEQDLLALAELPLTRELRSLEAGWLALNGNRLTMEAEIANRLAERQLRNIAERHEVKFASATFQGNPRDAIARHAQPGDVVAIAISEGAERTSTISMAKSALESSALVMFVPKRPPRLGGQVVAVTETNQSAALTVTTGKSIAAAMHAELIIRGPLDLDFTMPLRHRERLLIASASEVDASSAALLASDRKVPLLLLGTV